MTRQQNRSHITSILTRGSADCRVARGNLTPGLPRNGTRQSPFTPLFSSSPVESARPVPVGEQLRLSIDEPEPPFAELHPPAPNHLALGFQRLRGRQADGQVTAVEGSSRSATPRWRCGPTRIRRHARPPRQRRVRPGWPGTTLPLRSRPLSSPLRCKPGRTVVLQSAGFRVPDVRGGVGLVSEAAWLVKVSRAFASSPLVRELAGGESAATPPAQSAPSGVGERPHRR
jgi:hypothetical protein